MLFLCSDFHQGSEIFPPLSRGRQCVGNCLVFHALLNIKPLNGWSVECLNAILKAGDELYRFLKTNNKILHDYLAVSDLPKCFMLFGEIFSITLGSNTKNYSGTLKKELYYNHDLSMSLEFAFNLVFPTGNTKLSGILIFCDCAVSVIKKQNEYYIFDPHSRCNLGLVTENGHGQVSKHRTLETLCNFLRDLASSLTGCLLSDIQYEMHAFELKKLKYSAPVDQICKLDTFPSFLKYSTCIVPTEKQRSKLKRKHLETSTDHADQAKKKCPELVNRKTVHRDYGNEFISELAEKFDQSVSCGPIYVCTSCSQTWFKEGVVRLNTVKYNAKLLEQCSWKLKSVNNIEWVCRTCKYRLETGKIPECSIGNGMKFPSIPIELQDLSQLEQRLISPRLPFMSIKQQPRGGQLSMKGNVVNVPADVDKTVRVLPRTFTDNETVFIKLKRKLSYQHSVVQEMVRPNKVLDAVKLLSKSSLFKSEGICVDHNWSYRLPFSQQEDNSDEESDKDDSWTEDVDIDNRPSGNFDTVMHPIGFREFTKCINLAPGEGNCPIGIFQDINSEFLSFPAIYCGQCRPPNNQRLVPIHYSTIVKWELRNLDRRVAMSIPNIFFKMKKLQIKYLQERIQIAMRKCKLQGKKITVQDVLAPNAVDNIVKHNEGFQILRNLRGSPAYWESAKKDLFAMIRQIGIPHWFCSLSAAETKWLFLLKALGKLVDKKDYSLSDIEQWSWHKKSKLISSDPVTCARYFDYRVQKFIHDILLGQAKPLGEIVDYFYRVEFQQRGSPHIHMVVWVKDAPDVMSANAVQIANFIDKHICCKKDQSMPELVNYQTHRHARTCRKKGKSICRFNFPLPPMPRTVILSPPDVVDTCMSREKQNYEKIVFKLEEMKHGWDYTFQEFLKDLHMTEEEYFKALRSVLQRDTIYLKRDPSEIRINSYNQMMLKCWQANIDVQFILDPYSCASYIVSYISKGQRGMSNLMYNAVKEAKQHNLDLKHQLRHVGNKFLTHVEIGAQEAVYFALQMPLRRASRRVIFINTSPPEERLILLKSVPVLEEMAKNSTDIESDNVIKRYARRPKVLDWMCLADFASWFDISYPVKKKQTCSHSIELPEINDNDNLEDDPQSSEPNVENCFSEDIKEYVMIGGGVLRKRKCQKVLRYVRYNFDQDPDNYFRELLLLFHAWRNESKDIPTSSSCIKELYDLHQTNIEMKRTVYENKQQLLDVIETVMNDGSLCEENCESSSSFLAQSEHINDQDRNNAAHIPLSEKYGCYDPGKDISSSNVNIDIGITRKQIEEDDGVLKIPDSDYRKLVRSLNREQKEFFYHILHWFKTEDEPLYNFLSGGAGVGKSVLTRAVYQSLIRCLNDKPGSNPDDTKVLLCAPTGKAAHNINGNTIHSTFCIPVSMGFNYKPLAMEQLNVYRVKYTHLKVILIDEISMVGSKMFNFINCRLQEIMGNQKPFGGVSIIAVGDLYQLKPVMDNWIFSYSSTEYGAIASNLWQDNFRLFELHEIMRQKDDHDFARLLNRLREGLHTPADITTLKSRIVECDGTMGIESFPHLFTTCSEVDRFNEHVFSVCNGRSTTTKSIDIVTGNLHETSHSKVLEKIPSDPSKTMGLYGSLKLAEGLHAEISININVDDGLTNGAAGKIMYLDFRVENSDRCSIVWVLFEDTNIGKEQRNTYKHLIKPNYIQQSWTPIFEVSRKFAINNNHSYQITRRQFPLRLSAAKTIHKSQGSSLNNVVVHFGKRKNDHIHYVGLSRVRSLSGLHILELCENKISVSVNVMVEMERMRSSSSLTTCLPKIQDKEGHINIVFHNSRSLHLHISDLKCETYLEKVHVVGIAESRLMPSDNRQAFELDQFQSIRNDSKLPGNKRPYHGTVVYSQVNSCMKFCGNVQGIETTIIEISKGQHSFVLIFVYSPPKVACCHNFATLLAYIQSFICPKKTIILGDFNMDANVDSSLQNLMLEYQFQQKIQSITTDYGTTLDHIYSNIENCDIVTGVLECFYSDHKPIFLCIPVL